MSEPVSTRVTNAQTEFMETVANLLKVVGDEIPPELLSSNFWKAVAQVAKSASKVEAECREVKKLVLIK